MTDRELLHQALEALEKARDELEEYEALAHAEDYNDPRLNDAITALRERLAQPEHEWLRGECVKCGQSMEQPEQEQALLDAIVGGTGVMRGGKRVDPASIYKEPEPEPVAAQHRFRHPQKGTPDWSSWQPCSVKNRPAWEIDSQGYEVEFRALYTTPPRREWVGLTLEEFDEIHDRSDTMHEAMVDVVKKLREKNA